MAYSANKTKFYHTSVAEANEIEYLMEVPELGVAPEKIDVTTLGSDVKKYIFGIKDMGELVFKFLYDKATYLQLKGFGEEEDATEFFIQYPDAEEDADKTVHKFSAFPSVKMDAGSLNGALTFSCTMVLDSDIKIDE